MVAFLWFIWYTLISTAFSLVCSTIITYLELPAIFKKVHSWPQWCPVEQGYLLLDCPALDGHHPLEYCHLPMAHSWNGGGGKGDGCDCGKTGFLWPSMISPSSTSIDLPCQNCVLTPPTPTQTLMTFFYVYHFDLVPCPVFSNPDFCFVVTLDPTWTFIWT